MSNPTQPSLPYKEPTASTILIQTAFLLALNVINHVLDRTIYCGLIGHILVGMIFGTPLGKLLDGSFETAVSTLGYLGLIGVVFEGGLSTSPSTLKSNFALSTAVAVTGITLPIGLSYTLIPLLSTTSPSKPTPLQAFAAGAALCSTSLGMTFSVLRASGLAQTRLGVVLSTAAMLDDVVGLVMVQVISDLGAQGGAFDAVTVVRPVLVSVAFAVVVPGFAWFVVRPATAWVYRIRIGRVRKAGKRSGSGRQKRDVVETVLRSEGLAVVVYTSVLVGMVAGSSYAGTSNLFAAWLAGAVISWWDLGVEHPVVGMGQDDARVENIRQNREEAQMRTRAHVQTNHDAIVTMTASEGCNVGGSSDRGYGNDIHSSGLADRTKEREQDEDVIRSLPSHAPEMLNHETDIDSNPTTGLNIFEMYYQPALQRILKPFFFASIGFSIPITELFHGSILWRGLVYSLLMFAGKLACGIWLVRITVLRFGSGVGLERMKGTMLLGGRREGEMVGERPRDWSTHVQTEAHTRARAAGPGEEFENVIAGEKSNEIEMQDLKENIQTSGNERVGDHEQENPPRKETGRPDGHILKDSDSQSGNNGVCKIHGQVASSSSQSQPQPRRSNESRKIQRPTSTTTPTQSRKSMEKQTSELKDEQRRLTKSASKPISLYPAFIVGGAMTARGEIGFLISSLAQSEGIFTMNLSKTSNDTDSEAETSPIFLIVTWAIVLCTIAGPIIVGVLVRRLKRLERNAKYAANGKERDVLGVWGVE